jgi:iron(III) transport system substrate-binding protein
MRLPAARLFGVLLVAGVAIGLAFLWRVGRGQQLVVYCSHDAVFAESILRDFESETGISVAARFDTEATKSLGLMELLLREKAAPRCDVFWNNELFGTMELAAQGVLEEYRGGGWERIPPAFKDGRGRWTGFAARLRVHIVNTERMDADGAEVAQFNTPEPGRDLSRAAIAKPLYGTTLTHYAVLWKTWGPEILKKWHRESRQRGVREVPGNGAVKQIVAQGSCAHGLTDTDDFFDARDAGAPVAKRPVRLADGATICIPNTVAIIRGTRRGESARRLVDYLLSEKVEVALARSKARQIPLGPVDAGTLPEDVRELVPWAAQGVVLEGFLPARNECLAWLKTEDGR